MFGGSTKSGLFDVLTFGGGGAGGVISVAAVSFYCGCGGAGGVQQSTIYLDANQTITIGAGGSGATAAIDPTSGTSSTIGTLLSAVGGGERDAGGGDFFRDGCGGGRGGWRLGVGSERESEKESERESESESAGGSKEAHGGRSFLPQRARMKRKAAKLNR